MNEFIREIRFAWFWVKSKVNSFNACYDVINLRLRHLNNLRDTLFFFFSFGSNCFVLFGILTQGLKQAQKLIAVKILLERMLFIAFDEISKLVSNNMELSKADIFIINLFNNLAEVFAVVIIYDNVSNRRGADSHWLLKIFFKGHFIVSDFNFERIFRDDYLRHSVSYGIAAHEVIFAHGFVS